MPVACGMYHAVHGANDNIIIGLVANINPGWNTKYNYHANYVLII